MADEPHVDNQELAEDNVTQETEELDAAIETDAETEETSVEEASSESDDLPESLGEVTPLQPDTAAPVGGSLLFGDSDEHADLRAKLNLQKQEGRRGWYVIHTYSGYEDQVADSLRQRIESLGMQEKIFNVVVPKEKQIEIKNGKRRTVEKRIFPGYVMVEMVVTDDSWYVVRNTPNVTGFIGLGVQPTPIAQEEVSRIQKRMGVDEPKYKIELRADDLVKINDGPLKGFEGKVTDVDDDKGKIKVSVNMFGRETPVTLDFLQVKKV